MHVKVSWRLIRDCELLFSVERLSETSKCFQARSRPSCLLRPVRNCLLASHPCSHATTPARQPQETQRTFQLFQTMPQRQGPARGGSAQGTHLHQVRGTGQPIRDPRQTEHVPSRLLRKTCLLLGARMDASRDQVATCGMSQAIPAGDLRRPETSTDRHSFSSAVSTQCENGVPERSMSICCTMEITARLWSYCSVKTATLA